MAEKKLRRAEKKEAKKAEKKSAKEARQRAARAQAAAQTAEVKLLSLAQPLSKTLLCDGLFGLVVRKQLIARCLEMTFPVTFICMWSMLAFHLH